MSGLGDKHWTGEQVAFLQSAYADTGSAQIAAMIGKTPDSVRTKALRIGLHKAQEVLPDGLKRCPHCEQVKPLPEFWNGQSWCKSCQMQKANEWAKRNRERLARYHGVRVARDPDGMRAMAARGSHKQRARRKDGHDLTEVQWQQIVEKQGGICALCGAAFSESAPAVRDCVVPVSRGGALTASNVQAVHAACNRHKGTRTIRGRYA